MSEQPQQQPPPLCHQVSTCLDGYFKALNGHSPVPGLYRMVLEQVEKPLLQAVLEYSAGNQSRAAELLGITRATLRKKRRYYALDE